MAGTKDTENGQVPRGFQEIQPSSKNVTLKVRTVPLPKDITEFLTQHTSTIKSIIEQKTVKKIEEVDMLEQLPLDSGDKILSAEEFQSTLREKFAEAQKQGGPLAPLWENIVDEYVLSLFSISNECMSV